VLVVSSAISEQIGDKLAKRKELTREYIKAWSSKQQFTSADSNSLVQRSATAILKLTGIQIE
jgi:hypothetical protein